MMSRKLPSVLQSDRGSLGLEAVLKQIHEILSEIPSSEDDFEEDKINASLDHLDTMIAAIDRGDVFVDIASSESSSDQTVFCVIMHESIDVLYDRVSLNDDDPVPELSFATNTPIAVITGSDAKTKADAICKGKEPVLSYYEVDNSLLSKLKSELDTDTEQG